MDPLRANPFPSQSEKPPLSPKSPEPSSPPLSAPRSRNKYTLEDDLEAVRLHAERAKSKFRNDPSAEYKSSDEVTEERYQRLKHAPRDIETLTEKVKRFWGKTFTTSPELKGTDPVFEGTDPQTGKKMIQSRTAFFAEGIDRRRLANALHRNMLTKTSGVMHDILATVHDPKQFDLFQRKIFADEAVEAHARNRTALENEQNLVVAKALLEEAKRSGVQDQIAKAKSVFEEASDVYSNGPKYQHRELGETEDAALADQKNIDAILDKTPGLKSAYDRHLAVIHAVRDELISRGLIDPNAREFYFPHYIVDYMQDVAAKNLPRGVGLSKSKSVNVKRLIGGREWSRDYMTAMSTYLTRNMEMIERHNLLDEMAFRYHVTRRPMLSITRPREPGKPSDYQMYLDKGVIPEGYARYSLSSGYTKQRASSPAERLTGQLLDNSVEEIAKRFKIEPYIFDRLVNEWRLNPDLARNMESKAASGKINDLMPQEGTEVVIPRELADELTILAKADEAKAPLPGKFEQANRLFKTLAIHLRPIQYNVRNFVGDMNRAIAQFGIMPMSNGKLWKEAFHEVGEATFHKNFIGDWHDAHRYGILSSGRTAVETYRLRDVETFRKLTGEKPNLNTVMEMAKWAGPHWSQMREDITRLYIYKMNKVRGSKNMLLGAVDPEYVKGLLQGGEDARAFAAIARRSMIDFGDFTPSEDYLRNGLVPFYSWVKGNLSFWANDLPRAYGRAIKHLGTGDFSSSDAHSLQGAAVVAAMAATAAAWNSHNKDFADAQDKLPEAMLRQTHIILPGDDDKPLMNNGRPVVIAIPDALDDALDAVGMGGMGADLSAYFRGKISLDELMSRRAEAAYKGPINYAVRSAGPIPNLTAAAAGVRTYPDIFDAKQVPPERRLQTMLSAGAVSNIPGVPSVVDVIPGQVSSPSKTFDPIAQLGLNSVQTTRMPYYYEDLVRTFRKQENDLNDLKGRIRSTAGGLAEPQLTPEKRAARVEQLKRVLDLRVSEIRRTAERIKALQRTQEASQR